MQDTIKKIYKINNRSFIGTHTVITETRYKKNACFPILLIETFLCNYIPLFLGIFKDEMPATTRRSSTGTKSVWNNNTDFGAAQGIRKKAERTLLLILLPTLSLLLLVILTVVILLIKGKKCRNEPELHTVLYPTDLNAENLRKTFSSSDQLLTALVKEEIQV